MREGTFRVAGKSLVEVTAGSRTRDAVCGWDASGEKRGKRHGGEKANEDREAYRAGNVSRLPIRPNR